MSCLAKIVPKRSSVSTLLELAGLAVVSGGVWGLAGRWWGLISIGVSAVLYALALDR